MKVGRAQFRNYIVFGFLKKSAQTRARSGETLFASSEGFPLSRNANITC